MATPIVEAVNTLSFVRISVNYTVSDKREFIDGFLFRYDEEVNGTIEYRRNFKRSNQRWCKSSNEAAIANKLLGEGEFLINGSCCCTCGGTVLFKPNKKQVAGRRTYSYPDGTGDDPPPIPPPVNISISCNPGVTLSDCRGTFGGSSWTSTGTPVKPTITITNVRQGETSPKQNAEVTVLFQAIGSYYTGTANFDWITPDGTHNPFSISFPSNFQPIPNFTQASITGGSENIQITWEKFGFRIGFIGKWAQKFVLPVRLIDNSVLVTNNRRGFSRYDANVIGYLGTSPVGFTIAFINGASSARCIKSFVAIQRLSSVDHSLNGTVTYTGD